MLCRYVARRRNLKNPSARRSYLTLVAPMGLPTDFKPNEQKADWSCDQHRKCPGSQGFQWRFLRQFFTEPNLVGVVERLKRLKTSPSIGADKSSAPRIRRSQVQRSMTGQHPKGSLAALKGLQLKVGDARRPWVCRDSMLQKRRVSPLLNMSSWRDIFKESKAATYGSRCDVDGILGHPVCIQFSVAKDGPISWVADCSGPFFWSQIVGTGDGL